MAKDYKREDILYPDQKIIQSELVHEMQTSYIEYAMSVIVGRALPDVRDGLKPVHRRILYAMYEDNLTSDKPFKKSATCVGDVLGRYHPHGDASVYDAMVRLAQDFSMRYMLVDGHGNFGSVDGDPPAAYRYTEARLSKIANEMLRDIDKDTVDWDPNFDETRREPRVLPCRFPNLLVNGSSGIAVGMATNIPPHNLTEVINACVCVLENPDATLSDLMQHVTGPDFPTRGIIVGRSGIRAAYATGRGRIVVRARTETETWGHDRIRIIVTELPYQVNKRQLIQNISEQVRDKKLDGISGLRDESDRNGMRIVIELKKDANTQVVLNRLFAQTQMQTTFAVNMLALVDNQSQPKILSLRHILDEYLTFQEEIIVRRTKFDLKKALERAHLLEGLLIAEENIDEVIRIIRGSANVADAKNQLMERFGLSDAQAQAIVDMRLRALTGLEREKLENEYKELQIRIAELKAILADEKKLLTAIKEEINIIAEKYGDDRRTAIGYDDDMSMEDLIPDEDTVIAMTHLGYIKRMDVDNFRSQNRGGKGIKGMQTIEEDYIEDLLMTTNHHYMMFFTNTGRVYRIKAYEIPEAGRTARGTAIVNLLQMQPGEKITAIIPMRELNEDKYLFMATKKGMVKKTPMLEYENVRKNGLQAIVLRDDDELIEVKATDNTQDIFLVTKKGMCIRFKETDVRVTGRVSMGVIGMRFDEDDEVIGMQMESQGEHLLVVSENGMGKRTLISEFNAQIRGGKGVLCYKVTEKTGYLIGAKLVNDGREIMLITTEGIVIRMSVDDISVIGRNTSGVKLMNIDQESDIKVASIAKVRESATRDNEAEEEELEEALCILQDFDPAGIGARNLQECLMIQILRKKSEEKKPSPILNLEERIISDCYEEFTRKHWEKIIKKLDVREETFNEAIAEITKLNPRPGASLGETIGRNLQQIVPDFLVDTYDDGTINVSLNNRNVPELRMSRDFTEMVEEHTKNKANQSKESKEAMMFLKQKMDAAQGFIDAVKQRQNTLMTTMQAIIDLQRPFFLEGDESLLKPMILKDVAERTGLDISTISRVSNSKYVQTNFGIYPLKFFFSDGYTTEDGEEMSVREIRKILKECIDGEDKKKPLTDDELADILKEKGYPIARRTVAKYRQQLNIPVARLRK